jgi:LuxR family maltose regulon positive regulatory protein
MAVMEEAASVAPGPPGLFNPVPVQRARLLLIQGEQLEVARLVEEFGLRADDDLDYSREAGHLLLARLLIAQHRADQAVVLLERLDVSAERERRVESLIEIRTLRACALADLREYDAAISALAAALSLGSAQGYVRVFADEGAAVADVIGRLVVAQRSDPLAGAVPLGCLARLQRAFAAVPDSIGAGRPADRPGEVRLVDPLTSREVEILLLLADGTSNRSIADQLVVSVETVKKHVSHVLSKLGASNRTEAAARGRELGVIA